MSQNKVNLLMVGIGGYGHVYIDALQQREVKDLIQLAAIIDPMPEKAKSWPMLSALKIPTFDSIEAFLQAEIHIDLAAIASPISFHADQTCALLKAGINVLCEKPIAATTAEVKRMQSARNASGKFLEIGYQWSFSEAVQNLKKDILNGTYGKAQKLLTRVAWPRTSTYYNRNNWAGKILNSQGDAVYDSPVNNATAHYLHNMLYVLGPHQGLSATPTKVTAECYRANSIENYDTACLRISTQEGPELYFYTTHAVETLDGPVFSYQFEHAEIRFIHGGDIIADFKDGSTKNYGSPEADPMLKLMICAQQCLTQDEPTEICSAEAASAHTYCVEALQTLPVHTIAREHLKIKQIAEDETLTYIPEMEAHMRAAFSNQKLFSELKLPWTSKSAASTIAIMMPTTPR